MKIKSLIVVMFLGCCANIFAQQPNEKLEINIGNYSPHVPFIHSRILGQVGGNYQYGLNKSFSVCVGYTAWFNDLKLTSLFSPKDFFVPSSNGYWEEIGSITTWNKGDIYKRFNYQFLEATMIGKLASGKHEPYLSVGPSVALGKNHVIVYAHNQPGYDDWLVETEEKRATYFGGVLAIGYNYNVSKRISIGVSETIRCHWGLPAHFYNIINVGYKFNLLSKVL